MRLVVYSTFRRLQSPSAAQRAKKNGGRSLQNSSLLEAGKQNGEPSNPDPIIWGPWGPGGKENFQRRAGQAGAG